MYNSTPSLGTHQVENRNHLKFGSVLRRLKIDELPQLINYFKGDLSLIGPRPGLPNQKELTAYREQYNVYYVNPGITGLSQVLGYDMSSPELLAMVDNLYIKQKTNRLDVEIFFATFFNSFKRRLHKKYIHDIERFKEKVNHV